MLIEASHLSPNWLQSDSCNCQVSELSFDYRWFIRVLRTYDGISVILQCFIYDGVIRIVPGKFSTDLDVISKVAKILKKQTNSLEVEKNVSRVIEKKVERYVIVCSAQQTVVVSLIILLVNGISSSTCLFLSFLTKSK